MKKFVVERTLPGAGTLSTEELRDIARTSCAVIDQLDSQYHWVESYITEDKIYCIHVAENEEQIRKHAQLGNFPVNRVSEVKTIIDPVTSNLPE